MLSTIRRYLRPEIEIESGQELREGPAIVRGFVDKPETFPLQTPFRGVACVAYSYNAWCINRGGRGGPAPMRIKEVLAHGPFPLRLADGTMISAEPAKSTPGITHDDHKELLNSGAEGFYADEAPVIPGHKVELEGMVIRKKGTWILRYRMLGAIGKEEGAKASHQASTVRARKGKKGKKK